MTFKEAYNIVATITYNEKYIWMTKFQGASIRTKDTVERHKLDKLERTMNQVLNHIYHDEDGIIRLAEAIERE